MKIRGLWQGAYWYDPIEGAEARNDSVSFGMSLRKRWFMGGLCGEVWEDPPLGMPGRGRINGEVDGTTIRFVKQMPISLHRDGDQWVTLKQFLEQTFAMPVDQEIPHPPLLYVGEYEPDLDEIKGTWTFMSDAIQFLSNGQVMVFDSYKATGRWSARRVG